MQNFRLLPLAILLILAPACGDDDEDSPRDKCERLASLVCTRLADCAVEGGLIEASERKSVYDECSSEVNATIECERAVDVSDTYDQCVDDVSEAPCEVVNDPNVSLPDSCMGTILVE